MAMRFGFERGVSEMRVLCVGRLWGNLAYEFNGMTTEEVRAFLRTIFKEEAVR